jgi:hypothetical protein
MVYRFKTRDHEVADAATKKYIKWLITSRWALGSFALLCIVVFPRIRDQTWHPTLVNTLGALAAGFALIFVEKMLLQIISTRRPTKAASRKTSMPSRCSIG